MSASAASATCGPRRSAAGLGQVLAAIRAAGDRRACEGVDAVAAHLRAHEPGDAAALDTLAAGLADLEALRGLIATAVDERGEVRDSASRELAGDPPRARRRARPPPAAHGGAAALRLAAPLAAGPDRHAARRALRAARALRGAQRRARHRPRQLGLRRDDLRRAARRHRPRQPLARTAGAGAPRDRAHHAHALRGRRRGRA